MMKQFHFTTALTPSGELILPQEIHQQIARGEPLDVTLTVHTAVAPYPPDEREPTSLEALVEAIKKTPPTADIFQPAQINLAKMLLREVENLDPDFDEATWNIAWNKWEAEMKAEELAHEEAERLETWRDIC